MIRVGLVDFDTSHVVAFTQRWNHVGCAEDQWIEGAKVVAGCPGVSYLSPERANTLRVERVGLDELLARADVITLHVPLTKETKGIIDAAALA